MAQKRPTLDEADLIMKLDEMGFSNSEIPRSLQVTEGAIRYRIRRRASGKPGGRAGKPSDLDGFRQWIGAWIADYDDSRLQPTLRLLEKMLREHHGYQRSYDALRRYIRKRFRDFHQKGARMRLETPPGKLLFVDWKEDVQVQLDAPGFSWKTVVWFSFDKDLASFLAGHQAAFREYGGLPIAIRPDCLCAAIRVWRGAASALNERYRRYLEPLGMIVLPARPGAPEDKGKIEKRILDLFSLLDLRHRVYRDLEDLQTQASDDTGGVGVDVAFRLDRRLFGGPELLLREDLSAVIAGHFPTLPFKESRARVRRDGTVFFDGNCYQVPSLYRDQAVLCRHTGHEILIDHEGAEIGRFAALSQARGMVRLSIQALEDPTIHLSERVRIWGLEVARR